jgi:hypothetical protein
MIALGALKRDARQVAGFWESRAGESFTAEIENDIILRLWKFPYAPV